MAADEGRELTDDDLTVVQRGPANHDALVRRKVINARLAQGVRMHLSEAELEPGPQEVVVEVGDLDHVSPETTLHEDRRPGRIEVAGDVGIDTLI
jgi:hypothetical protein